MALANLGREADRRNRGVWGEGEGADHTGED
jgi:hypothetical protein